MPKAWAVASWIAQALAAIILLQTLYFKFTGAPVSRHIFEVLGMEPWGRYASGAAELIAGLLLLVPRTAVFGAMLAIGVMIGAIGSHLTKLGIKVPDFDAAGKQLPTNDGGTLFALACVVVVASLVVLWIRRKSIPVVGKKFA